MLFEQDDWQKKLEDLPTPCRHRMAPVDLPNGTTIYASSHHKRDLDEIRPDIGVYLDGIWKPDCIAFRIDWPDFDYPNLEVGEFVKLCEIVLDWAGHQIIEVGCIGGHGRTGTMLACLAVVAGAPPDDAIEWIKANYCEKAVETERQEWFVDHVHRYIHNLPFGQPPPASVVRNAKKGEHEGTTVQAKIDFNQVQYCPLCLTDKEGPVCSWCGATLTPTKEGS